jgi:NTE family protein
LGAFSCGVFKALIKERIKIDIVAGTSIGAINAAIITGSKSSHPEIDLENFWLELDESNYEIISDIIISSYNWLQNRIEYKTGPSASTISSILSKNLLRFTFQTVSWKLFYS